jgi:mRNA interferase RelE/StbE
VDDPQPYQIEAQPALVKQMKGIPTHEQRRILERIYQLADEPRPAGVEKLTDVEGWRIRVGDYRVVYWIDDSQRVVTITRVRKRGDVYRRK